jgi:hypothetical protein
MNITFDKSFNGLALYGGTKAVGGFYVEILSDIHAFLVDVQKRMPRARIIHIVVDSPKHSCISTFGEILTRWAKQRSALKGAEIPRPAYFYVLETRPRAKTQHLHVIVAMCQFDFSDVINFCDRLRKSSNTAMARLQSRHFSKLRYKADSETGEILTRADGSRIVEGSRHWHYLTGDFADTFERVSYLAKVFSKSARPVWSLSRLARLDES